MEPVCAEGQRMEIPSTGGRIQPCEDDLIPEVYESHSPDVGMA
jgi:hypothetical protein